MRDPDAHRKLDRILDGVMETGTALRAQSEQIRLLAGALSRLVESLTAKEQPDEGGRSLRELLADLIGQIERQNRQLQEVTQVQVEMVRTLPGLIAEAVVKAIIAARA